MCFTLASDVEHLNKAVVVGHDWGAMMSWIFALRYPARTKALVVMAVPHPELYRALEVVKKFELAISVCLYHGIYDDQRRG